MSVIDGPALHVPIPDDLSVVQFILDTLIHPLKLNRDGVPWLIDDISGRRIGYDEIRTRVYGLANGLSRKWNFEYGSTVCICAPNHVDYCVAVWACGRLGAIASLANPTYTADELVHQLKISNATYIVTVSSCLPVVLTATGKCSIPNQHILLFDDAPGFLSIDSVVREGLDSEPSFTERRLMPGESKTKVAFLCFSSGTTGHPKAVAISHYAVIANAIQLAAAHKITESYIPWPKRRYRPGYVVMAVLPFFHVYGLIVSLTWFLYCGMTVVVMPKFDLVQMLDSIVRHRITHLPIVPPQAVLLAKHPVVKRYDLSHVQLITSGAAPFSAELLAPLSKVFPNAEIGQGYGMTESATVVSVWPISQRYSIPGSAGQLLPGYQAKVIKPDGSLGKPGEEGELYVKSPSLALGYYGDPKATAETFVEGWLRTGDVGYFREGELFITDRLKEFIKVRAFQVAPAEIEGHLLGHPMVTDACVVGVPDDFSGELPMAYIVLEAKTSKSIKNDPAAAEALKQALKKHVSDAKASYKTLDGGIEFIDAIPKSLAGKLLRRVLRDRARQERGWKPTPISPQLTTSGKERQIGGAISEAGRMGLPEAKL